MTRRYYDLALILTLLLTLILAAATPARPELLTVDPDVTSTLSFDNLDDYAERSGHDPSRIIAVWVARADGYQSISRSTVDYDPSVAGGGWAIRGGTTGGNAYGRLYDGVTDYDRLGSEASDSTEMRDGILYEILFRSTSTGTGLMLSTGHVHGIFLDQGRVRVRINATYVVTEGGIDEYFDGLWHLARLFITADSAMAVVDDNDPVLAAHTQPLADPAYQTAFGAHPSGTLPFQGAIESIAMIDYAGSDPYEIDTDGHWSMLKSHIDASLPFAGPQAAIDYAAAALAGGNPDTIQLLPGTYPQPLEIVTDDLTLLGYGAPHRVTLDGSSFAAGSRMVNLNNAANVTLSTLTLRDGSTAVSSNSGSSGAARNLVISGNAVAVESSGNAITDTLKLVHCTIDRNEYAISFDDPDDGRVQVLNTCITWTETAVLLGSPPLSAIPVGKILLWENGTVVPGNHLLAPPMYAHPAVGLYRLLPASPALNAGDPALGYDDDGTLPDLGAYTGSLNGSANLSSRWTLPRWQRERWIR